MGRCLQCIWDSGTVTHTALKVQQQQHLKILNVLSRNFFEKSSENLDFSNKDINEATHLGIILEVHGLPHFNFILPTMELLFFPTIKFLKEYEYILENPLHYFLHFCYFYCRFSLSSRDTFSLMLLWNEFLNKIQRLSILKAQGTWAIKQEFWMILQTPKNRIWEVDERNPKILFHVLNTPRTLRSLVSSHETNVTDKNVLRWLCYPISPSGHCCWQQETYFSCHLAWI